MSNKKKIRSKRFGCAAMVLCALAVMAAFSILYSQVWSQNKRYVLYYQEEIAQSSERYGLDPYLVSAMIFCESSFEADAVSSVGAVGLMQIMPETGDWLAHKTQMEDYDGAMLLRPSVNIALGCWYLDFLINRYDGDWECAIAAYHSGQGRVDAWLADPAISSDGKTLKEIPEGETKKYTSRVLSAYVVYKKLHRDAF